MNPQTEVKFDDNLNVRLCRILKSFSRKHPGDANHFGGKQFLYDDEHPLRVCVSKKKIEIMGFSHDGEKDRNLCVSDYIDTVTMQHRIDFVDRLLDLYMDSVIGERRSELYVVGLVYHREALRNKLLFMLGKVFADKLIFSAEFDRKNVMLRVSMYNNANTRRLFTVPITAEEKDFIRADD